MRRPAGWAVLTALGLGCLAIGTVTGGARADATPVVLEGAGDSDLSAVFTDWQDTMFLNDQPVDLPYYQRGTKESRAQLLTGEMDYVIGGVGFSDDELKAKGKTAADLIQVPLAVTALSIFATTPPATLGGWGTISLIPNAPDGCYDGTLDDSDCFVTGQFNGPWKIPADNLSALVLELPATYQNNMLATWRSPTMVAALGTSSMYVQGRVLTKHDFINRSEGAAQNEYLMQYAASMSPSVWAMKKAQVPGYAWEPIGEQFSSRNLSYNGADTVIGRTAYMADRNNQIGESWSGNMTGVPTIYRSRLLADYPKSGFVEIYVQNRHGDFVQATPASIGAAVAAGTTPNIGATNDVPGAYPLTWVTSLYTLAGGLTPDEANGLAAFIRYAVTDGQAAIVAKGGVAVTTALRDEALADANRVVTTNCPAATHQVVSDGPSEFEPNTAAVNALTGVQHCRLKPAPTTTTTTTTTTTVPATTTTVADTSTTAATTTTAAPASTAVVASEGVPVVTNSPYVPSSGSSGSYGSGSFVTVPLPDEPVDDVSTEGTDVPSTDVATGETTTVPSDGSTTTIVASAAPPGGGGAGTRPRGVSLSDLPLGQPDDGTGGFQKLGTLLLGAGAFLFARRLVLARRVAT